MIRITTILLCFLVAVSAAGRYQAETAVREARGELRQVKAEQTEELRAIKMLRAEVAFLENPDRLAKIAAAKTDLRPTTNEQSLSTREFAVAMGVNATSHQSDVLQPSEFIANAIAMAQLGTQTNGQISIVE